MNKLTVGGILEVKDLTMIEILGIPNLPGSAGQYLTLLGDAGINLHFIAELEDKHGYANIAICLHHRHADQALEIINNTISKPESVIIKSRPHVGLLTVYGPHFREKPAISSRLCFALGTNNINILGISSSVSSVCCVVTSQDYSKAYASLLTVFSLP
ncbi:MAG: hypothetical protein HQ562_05985 [Candidatus Marinimicrobia bacterium]|nr:hypothetical protein [Candidatus Neomarinimicrobiota bacterium]